MFDVIIGVTMYINLLSRSLERIRYLWSPMFSLRCHNLYYENLWCRRRMHFRISSCRSPRHDAFAVPNSASLPIIRLHLLNLFKFYPYFIPKRTILWRIRRTTLAVKSYRLQRPLSYGPSTPKIHVIFESVSRFRKRLRATIRRMA